MACGFFDCFNVFITIQNCFGIMIWEFLNLFTSKSTKNDHWKILHQPQAICEANFICLKKSYFWGIFLAKNEGGPKWPVAAVFFSGCSFFGFESRKILKNSQITIPKHFWIVVKTLKLLKNRKPFGQKNFFLLKKW